MECAECYLATGTVRFDNVCDGFELNIVYVYIGLVRLVPLLSARSRWLGVLP